MKNPNWTEEELILALELYFRVPSAIGDNRHPEVEKLSTILNRLGVHPSDRVDRKFRNANGVATKLSNFRAHDPNHDGGGLAHGSKLEKVVWQKYADDLPALKKAAKRICEEHGIYDPTSEPSSDVIREKIDEVRALLTEIERLVDQT